MLIWCWEHLGLFRSVCVHRRAKWMCFSLNDSRGAALCGKDKLHMEIPVPCNDLWLPLIKLWLLYVNRRVMLPWHTICCTTEMWSTYSCLEHIPAFAHSCQIWDESQGLRGILEVVSLCHFLRWLQEDTLYFPLKCCWQCICIVFSHARIPQVTTVRGKKMAFLTSYLASRC